MDNVSPRYWEEKALEDMTDSEWEALCDGCGRCCLQKLEDDETGEIHYTRVSCRLLDTSNARCTNYSQRFSEVPDCLAIRPLTDEKIQWLPDSCAYKKIALGHPLESWHPLISGTSETVINAGISAAGHVISETEVPVSEFIEYLIEWRR